MGACVRAPRPPPDLVVDWARFAGEWHEFARYDNAFERGLTGCTATYTPRKDGRIDVVNRGWKRVGARRREQVARGVANITGNATLSVSFVKPFHGEYNVLALSPAYRWAVVGSRTRAYLWLLSRAEARRGGRDAQHMLDAAAALGYDTDKLVFGA